MAAIASTWCNAVPFQVKYGGPVAAEPETVAESDLVLRTRGAVIGPSIVSSVGAADLRPYRPSMGSFP